MDNGLSGNDATLGAYFGYETEMRLYIIVDPINHVLQLGMVTHFGLVPLAEYNFADFRELRNKVNAAWDLYQKAALQPRIVQDIESIEALDKL